MRVICRPPFSSDSCYGVLRRIVEEQPRPINEFNPEVPQWLQKLIQRLMEKDLDQRLGDAATLATELRQCLNHLRDPHQSLPADLQPIKPRTLHLKSAFLIVFVAAVLSIVVIARTMTPVDAPDASRQTLTAPNLETTGHPDSDYRWNDGIEEMLRNVEIQMSDFETSFPLNDQRGRNE